MHPPTVPPVPVYAGDTCQFPSYTFTSKGTPTNLLSEGWVDWRATWQANLTRPASALVLTVDSTKAAQGILTILATATQTRKMTSGGVWDLQATRGAEVRTFITGTTNYQADVTT